MTMIFGKIFIHEHAIERYKTRVMLHRNLDINESNSKIKRRILNELNLKNVIKTIRYGEKYCYVFTRSNVEFRFEKGGSKSDAWNLMTVIKHNRMLESEEPIDIENIKGQKYGIRTAIRIRERDKAKWEKEGFKYKERIKSCRKLNIRSNEEVKN